MNKDSNRNPVTSSLFERHPVLTALVIGGLFAVTLLALVESSAAPRIDVPDRPGSTRSVSQHRGLIVREWQPNRDHRFGTPPERKSGSREPVKDAYRLKIDALGFIEPSIIHASPDMEIAFIGGSTTECLYMEPEQRFPYLAGRLLEQRSGLRVNALNAGKSGNTSMHSLINYLGKIAPLKPRYVLMLNALNDIGVLNSQGTYWSRDQTYGILRERERTLSRYGEDLRAMTFPAAFGLLGDGWKALRYRIDGWLAASAQDGGPIAASPGAGSRGPVFREQFEASLRSFVRLAKAWGSRPVLMTQVLVLPDGARGHSGLLSKEELERGGLDMSNIHQMQIYANAMIRHVAQTEGALLIDLAAAREWRNGEDVYDGLHFTAAGAGHVAGIVAAALDRDLRTAPAN